MSNKNPASHHRSFSLSLYLLVIFGLSWPFQIAGAFWADSLPARFTLTSISMLMVAIGTFLCGRYIFRDGFVNAGWNWGKPKHYLAVIGLALLLYAVPSLIAVGLGRSVPTSLSNEQLIWISIFLFGTLLPAFGEEMGWRGYMLPRLARHNPIRKAIILHAVIWWIWHLPASVGMVAQNNMGIPASIAAVFWGAIPAILHAVIFAYIWSSSRSLAVATVYHAAYDGVRDSLQMVLGFGAITVLWANVLIIVLGVWFLQKGKWRGLESASIS